MAAAECLRVTRTLLNQNLNKGEDVANYVKERDVTAQGGKWLNWLHSILGRFSLDFRKLKILGKHLLPQCRVREF